MLHKDSSKLTDADCWYLNRYLNMSPELKEAYTLKESYKKWQREAKTSRDITEVKLGLEAFYSGVEFTNNPAFLKAIKT